jgi:hypothetical protein
MIEIEYHDCNIKNALLCKNICSGYAKVILYCCIVIDCLVYTTILNDHNPYDLSGSRNMTNIFSYVKHIRL